MKYRLTGNVEIRDTENFAELKIVKHTEDVEASSEEEAIEVSLSGFSEEEEPVWCQGYPVIKPAN